MDLEFGSKFVTKPMKARVPSDAGWGLRIWGFGDLGLGVLTLNPKPEALNPKP